jgi:L-aspartate oxidase
VTLDTLVVGSGVAGLSVAVRLADAGVKVGVVTKAALSETTTRWAQGGVAAVLHDDEDSTDLHLADTLRAGAGLCDVDAVRVLVDEGPARVEELIALGAVFDREATGALQRAREGGHSHARILHAGGAATGAEVERALVAATQGTVSEIREHAVAVGLLVEDGTCRGIAIHDAGGRHELESASVVLATGGAGQLFEVTTNPTAATGDGLAIALRAGVPVSDVEFMQFHPTALHHPAMPRPLLSEALRGHGAILRNARGDRFVDELAPRDVVSRAMATEMAREEVSHLWLDATGLEEFAARFPTLAASLAAAGLDPEVDWLPIAPAAHHLAGGIVTDLDGATALPGLFAVGEVACTGVHGANRLASNSLLEGMVFAARLSEALEAGQRGPSPSGAMRAILGVDGGIPVAEAALEALDVVPCPPGTDVATARRGLQHAMTAGAGVVRSSASLDSVRGALALAKGVAADGGDAERAELANLVTCAEALLTSAVARTESRGCHVRAEYPDVDPAWRRRLVLSSRT